MKTAADQIIDALGGTTIVSRMTDAPLSTVHSWRKNGIPRSRLAHLRLLAAVEKPSVDVDAILNAAHCPSCPRRASGEIAACVEVLCPCREKVAA